MENLQTTPILILHGWGSSEKNWRFVREHLEAKGYKVYIPDLPGFGSNAALEKVWLAEDYAEWVKQWAERQNLLKFYLAGHSFGGGVAAVFASKYPEKVERLIFIAAAISRQKTFRQRFFKVISKIGNFIFTLPALSFIRPQAQRILHRVSGSSDYRKVVLQQNPFLAETFKNAINNDLAKYLSKISVPTLLVWGDKDQMTPLAQTKIIIKTLSRCKLIAFKGKGHPLNFEAPKELADAMIDFLNSKESA